jgi:Zn-dependent protease
MSADFIALGAIWYVVFLFSTTCHEAAHSLVAKLGGDPTASHGGQVSLNPIPHIRREPFGLVVVPIISYALAHWMIGYASAPYDPAWQRRYPHRAARMALAGPAANLTLALLAAVAIRAGIALGAFALPSYITLSHIVESTSPDGGFGTFAATFLSIAFVLNVLLGTFNLLPVPPLDGLNAITLLMPEGAALRFLDFSRSFGFIGILLAWVVYNRVFGFIFGAALSALYVGLRGG